MDYPSLIRVIVTGGLVWASAIGVDPAVAQAPQSRAFWEASVTIDGKTISLTAVSKSGDPSMDDTDVTIVQDGQRIPVPVRKAMYEPANVSSDQRNSWTEPEPIFKIAPHIALVILTENARPVYPFTTLVAYDYDARRILDIKERVGSFKQESPFDSRYILTASGPGRYRIRLIKEYVDVGSNGPEAFIEAWLTIRVVHGKLECAWQ